MGNITLNNTDWSKYDEMLTSILTLMFNPNRIKIADQYKEFLHFDNDIWTRRYHKTTNMIHWYIHAAMESSYQVNRRLTKIISKIVEQFK